MIAFATQVCCWKGYAYRMYERQVTDSFQKLAKELSVLGVGKTQTSEGCPGCRSYRIREAYPHNTRGMRGSHRSSRESLANFWFDVVRRSDVLPMKAARETSIGFFDRVFSIVTGLAI